MAYVTYEEYQTIYADGISEADFNRLDFDAERYVDTQTTGIDDVRKLKVAYPTDEYAQQCVVRCICKLISTMYQIEQQENMMALTSNGNGARGGMISSVSSGSESISYNNNIRTGIQNAVIDPEAKRALLAGIIKSGLSGVCDANGVHLLYMGIYPYEIEVE